MAARKEIPRELSIYINDRQVINSLGGVTREISKVNAEMRNLNKNSATYDQDLKKLQGDLTELKDKQSAFKDEIHATNQAGSAAAETFSKIYIGLTSGNLPMAKEGLQDIGSAMGGLVKSAVAFIATPIGAAIAVLSGFALGAKAVFDFNIEAEKSARLIENLSGKTGQVVEDIRVKINALTDTFGVAFDGVAKAVDNLVDTGVAKDELQALEQIKNGLLTAPDKNEFLSSLESSAVAAKEIGADLNTVIALKQAIEETGVDPEKTFGALQKASLNLATQTDVLRKSLTDAFGAGFTDDILAKIKTGQLTTVQALDLINKKSKEVGLNQTQQGELTKEIFGKAGLAAGGFATILDTVTAAQQRQSQGLNENQKATDVLVSANERLGKAQSELFRIEGFGSMWDLIKAKATDALASVIEYIVDLKKDIQPLLDIVGVIFVAAWQTVKLSVTEAFAIISGVLKGFSNYIGTFVAVVSKLLKGDFRGAFEAVQNGIMNFGIIIKNTFGSVYNAVIDVLEGIVKVASPILKALGVDVDSLQKKLESFKSKKIELKTSSNSTVAEDEKANTKATQEELAKQKEIRDAARQKEAEARAKALAKKKEDEAKAAKEEYDRALNLAKAKADLAKAELNLWILNNRSKLESGQKLTQDSLNQEIERLKLIKDRQVDEAIKERDRKIQALEEKAKIEKMSEEELSIQKQTILTEFETTKQTLELGFLTSTTALKKQFTDEEKQAAAEQLQIDNELALADAETKAQEEAIKLNQDYQAKIDSFKKLLEDKKITQEEYDRFEADATKKKNDLETMMHAKQIANTLGALGTLAGALTDMFGQSKEMAVASALINGALAVTNIFATTPMADFGLTTYALLAASAISTIASVNKIVSQKAPKQPKIPKLFYGGPTGSSAMLGNDEFGPMTGVVHRDEWVGPAIMTQSPRYAPIFSYLEGERQKIYGNKLATGGVSSPGTIGTIVPTNDESTQLLKAVLYRLENPVAPNLNFGYDHAKSIEDLNTERKQSTSNGTLNS